MLTIAMPPSLSPTRPPLNERTNVDDQDCSLLADSVDTLDRKRPLAAVDAREKKRAKIVHRQDRCATSDSEGDEDFDGSVLASDLGRKRMSFSMRTAAMMGPSSAAAMRRFTCTSIRTDKTVIFC